METNRATQHMVQGYVCSESVLLAVCQELELEIDDRIIPRIANPLAGWATREPFAAPSPAP